VKAPFLFAVGFVTMFTIGGLSGVTHAIVPADTQQTDTYYIVAHFHYVLFGGSIFGLFAGAYYWWPKFTGKMLSDRLGKLHFWLMFIGFNATFGPFHILGLQGMPRRIYRYPAGRGWDFWNFVATVGSFIIALSVLVFIINVLKTRKTEKVGEDPWDARTLEWTTASPPPEYNFEEVPIVTARDELWHRKYTEDEHGRPVLRSTPESERHAEGVAPGELLPPEESVEEHEEHNGHHIHMPSPSYYPLVASIGLPMVAYGLMFKAWPVAVIGGLTTLGSLYGWALEPATAPEDPQHEAVSEPEPDPEPASESEPDGAPQAESGSEIQSESESEPAPTA
jgi:cytochrome c oxidase subunit 1